MSVVCVFLCVCMYFHLRMSARICRTQSSDASDVPTEYDALKRDFPKIRDRNVHIRMSDFSDEPILCDVSDNLKMRSFFRKARNRT